MHALTEFYDSCEGILQRTDLYGRGGGEALLFCIIAHAE